MYRVYPRQPVPQLIFQSVEGGNWDIVNSNPEFMTLIVFYRGYHCSACRKYLTELDSKLDEFKKRGVDVVAVSADNTEKAKQAKEEWGIERLEIGCNLNLDTAQNWGLFISKGIKESEPEMFTEPGDFLIDKDKKLYSSSIQSAQYARPPIDDLIKALDFIKKENYPARGEVMEIMEPVGQPKGGRIE